MMVEFARRRNQILQNYKIGLGREQLAASTDSWWIVSATEAFWSIIVRIDFYRVGRSRVELTAGLGIRLSCSKGVFHACGGCR